ncbi:MAG: putative sulfate exporter family transporter, partial [Dehalococcoidia bacterium]
SGIATIWDTLILFVILAILSLIGLIFMKKDIKRFVPAFIVIFALAWLAVFIGKQSVINAWGLEYVIWALIFGLLISNTVGLPGWLKPAVLTEYFIKIGLVCMGATILFSIILKAGGVGMLQALLVVAAVWFFTYWLGRRFGMAERFSSTMATGVSICGVSASIAAGGAVKGDPKETSYIIAWLLVGAVIMIVVMPPIAKAVSMPTNMAGAWLGGTIDNTGAVVAAGEVMKSKASLDTAALVKMAQNILIGFAAFLLAVWATLKLDKKSASERPSFMEIWYRFPKFIVGFIIASLIASLFIEPVMGTQATKTITGLMTTYRTWFFALCFVCIGLETNFKELLSVGGGKPAAVYWIGQTFNVVWTLLIVWLLWSGTFFIPPILPD